LNNEFCYNSSKTLRCYNPIFFNDTEEDIKKARMRFVETQFVIMGDGKTRIGSLEIRLQHTWETYRTIDKK
jgi:hypothetical protein